MSAHLTSSTRSRRGFMLAVLAAGSSLSLGCATITDLQRVGSPSSRTRRNDSEPVEMNAWLRISADESIIVSLQRAEMGQGVSTILPMLVAEELDCDWSRVTYSLEEPQSVHANVQLLFESLPFRDGESGLRVDTARWFAGQAARLGIVITGGSTSVRDAWMPLRLAGASARQMLLHAAAQRWGVDEGALRTDRGIVIAQDGRKASYGQLALEAAQQPAPETVSLKPPARWTLLGTSPLRIDVLTKVTGAAQFGADVRLPGQLYAAVVMAPSACASLKGATTENVQTQPGVAAVVQAGSVFGSNPAIVIAADSFWAANNAAKSVVAQWDTRLTDGFDSDRYGEKLKETLTRSGASTWRREGTLATAIGSTGLRLVQAQYETPFLAHAAIEPHCCTALYRTGNDGPSLELWVPTQLPTVTLMVAAQAAGLSRFAIRLHSTLIGGGFGYKGLPDTVVQAVSAAKALPNTPVQVQWTREQDLQFDTYRPAAAALLMAWIDGTGKVVGWRHVTASASVVQSLMTRSLPAWIAGFVPDKTSVEGAFDKAYDLGAQEVDHHVVACPIPVGFWRSVGHSHQAFFVESFIDEIAHASGQDPLALRRRLLASKPRQLRVLETAAQAAGWDQPLPKGHARGIAFHESFGSICAQVLELSTTPQQAIRIERVVCAVDCGTALHPDMVRQQIEGGITYGLTAALYGEVKFVDGRAQISNFNDYRLSTLAQTPDVQTVIVNSGQALGGIGEVSTPPIAPALSNALFALTGQRARSLPLSSVYTFA